MCERRLTSELRAAHALLPWRDPLELALVWAMQPGTLWLDSADGEGWSYLLAGSAPTLQGHDAGLLDRVEQALAGPFQRVAGGPPFQGGAAGLLGYELGRALEPALRRRPLPALGPTLPTAWLALYRDVVAFDHAEQVMHVVCQPWGASAPRERLQAIVARLTQARATPPTAWSPPLGRPQRDLAPEDYAADVAEVVARIGAGDVFQVNLSQRFTRTAPQSGWGPMSLYGALRAAARPAFGAWLYLGPQQWVASVSPERLVSVRDGVAQALPIKGTRPRSADPQHDARLLQDLLASEKDRAENTMIVDLLRNDLSKVAARGGVSVPRLCAPLTLPTVHHLVSEVRAQLRPEVTAVDVVRAVFPGGSITGAPKVEAMQIIQELELARRGPYCGSLGWLSPDGALDLSIGIRTACPHNDGAVVFSAGGGVVFDSDPMAEVAETVDKARVFLELGA